MINGTTINIEILVGLPGSGKTYYAQHIVNGNPNIYFAHVDFDEFHPVHPGIASLLKRHNNNYGNVFYYFSESRVIFDGLFTTHTAQERIVDEWIELFNSEDENKTCKTNIKFIYFKEDREACLVNDSSRGKERSAHITIKQMPLEKPEIEKFKEKYNDERFTFEIEEKEIHKMNKYESVLKPHVNKYWSDKLGYDVMVSDQWRTGGTLCSYDGWETEVEPQRQPQTFTEFDDLLEKLCPNISFLTYKKR